MIIEKSKMSIEELKEAAKQTKDDVIHLKRGDMIQHKGESKYIAIVEKIYKNGRIDLKVIEENGKPVSWRMSFKNTITKFTDVLYTFNECYTKIN